MQQDATQDDLPLPVWLEPFEHTADEGVQVL